MIQIRGLDKSFGDLHVLDHIDLDVNDGETVAIIGPSGSGKSTLLRCLNLLEVPQGGSVSIDNHHYEAGHIHKKTFLEMRRATGMVFQDYNLFANHTVLENITLPLKIVKKQSKDQATKTALALLEKVDLVDKKDAYPNALSGGQMQRVAIARALALKPSAILYDEPTSALDPELVSGVLDVIKDVSKDNTTIIVTHEMAFARDVADRVVFMADGHIIEQGPASVLMTHPQKERTKQFLDRFLNS
jgi:putative amino-acid transport system ATP-binding protein